jgi:hypothetical protein
LFYLTSKRSTHGRDNFNHIDRSQAVQINGSGTAKGAFPLLAFESLPQILTGNDFPELVEMNGPQYVVSYKDAAQRPRLLFDFVPNRLREESHVDPHNAELYDCAITLTAEENFTGIIIPGSSYIENFYIDNAFVVCLHGYGHVLFMTKQSPVCLRHLGRCYRSDLSE